MREDPPTRRPHEAWPLRTTVHLLALCVGTVIALRSAGAQDSVHVDSARADSVAAPETLRRCYPHCMQHAVYALFIAPPLLMQLDDSTMGRGAPLGNSVAVSGGYGFGMSIDHSKTAHLAGAEIIYGALYAEYREATLKAPGWTLYRSARLGYLKRTWRSIAVGVIVGQRTVRGAVAENGLEVALPFISSGRAYLLHIETAYVATDHHVSWNWRFDGEFFLEGSPAFLGFSTGLQTLRLRRHGQLSSGTVMLMAGVRHRFGTERPDR